MTHMTQQQIHEQIDQNNEMIKTLFSSNTFTLNHAVAELMKENIKLQEQCKHEFKDGRCIYCYKEE